MTTVNRYPLVTRIDIYHARARLELLRVAKADAIRTHGLDSPEFAALADEADSIETYIEEYRSVR